MTKDFNKVVIQDLSDRFGEDVAERFKGKELLKSIQQFYKNENNYLKHTKGLKLNTPPVDELETLGDLSISDISAQIVDSLQNNKPLLFVVGNDKEYESVEVLLRSFQNTLADYGEQVRVVKAADLAASTSKIKSFSKEMAMEDDDEFNIINIGMGFNNGFMERHANRMSVGASKAKATYVSDGDPSGVRTQSRNLSSQLADDSKLSVTQLIASAAIKATAELEKDEYFAKLSLATFRRHAETLAKLGNQASKNNVPLEYRTEDREELSTFTALSSSYAFFDSLSWTRDIATSNVAKVVDPALLKAGVDRVKFKKHVDEINQLNVMAGAMRKVFLRAVEHGVHDGFNIEYEVAKELNKLDKEEFEILHSKDNLRDLRLDLIELETKPYLASFETQYLGRLKEVALDLRRSNSKLKDTLKKGNFISVENIDSTKVVYVKDDLLDLMSTTYLRGLVQSPLDGTLMITSEGDSELRKVATYSSISTISEVSRVDFSDQGLEAGMTSRSEMQIKKLSGNPVTKEDVNAVAKIFDEKSKKVAAKKAEQEPPVIVAEPETLGKALAILSYMNAGHSHGIDTNINFRIPKKHKLKVTLSSGLETYKTVDEIVNGYDDIATIECTYKPEGTANYTGEKSIYISKEMLVDMHKDVGKKRYYGPLKASFSAKGVDGNMHIQGYDPNFSIRYKKDILLKPSNDKQNLIDDGFWREMKRRGYVQHITREENIMNVNGVHINAKHNFNVFKSTVLKTVDKMNGGAPDLIGDNAYWCLDTETTGLKASEELINFGGSAYSVVRGSGEIVHSDDIYTSLSGEQFCVSKKDGLEAISLEDATDLPASEVVSVDGKLHKIVSGFLVENIADMGNGDVVVNRQIKQDYTTMLVKNWTDKQVPTVIEKLTGLTAEQVNKHGLPMMEVERIFERETSKFGKNCFVFHNSDFDTNVIAAHSVKMAEIMTTKGNFVADTIRLTRKNNPNVRSEDFHTIKYGKRITVQFSNKEDVLNFLRNGNAGDELMCAKGSLELFEDKGTLKLRLKNGKAGIIHKEFNANNRTVEALESLFEAESKTIYPMIKVKARTFMNFENKGSLKDYIANAQDGQKLRAIGGGYLQVHDGDIYAYHNGVATAATKIASVGDDYDKVVSAQQVERFQSDMENLVSLQKAKDILEVAFPSKQPNLEAIKAVLGDDMSEETYALSQRFVNGFDLSKTVMENVSNFKDVMGDTLADNALVGLAKAVRSENKLKLIGLNNIDALRTIAPVIEKMGITKEGVAKASKNTGIDERIGTICAKALQVTKSQKGLKNLFLKQSHNNATRFNSDACVEAPVATNAVFDKVKNGFDLQASIDNFVCKLGDSAIEATHEASHALNKNPIINRGNELAMGLHKSSGILRELGRSHIEGVDVSTNYQDVESTVLRAGGLFSLSQVREIREISESITAVAKINAGKSVDDDYAEVFAESGLLQTQKQSMMDNVQEQMKSIGITHMEFAKNIFDDTLVKQNIATVYNDKKMNLEAHNRNIDNVNLISDSYKNQMESIGYASCLQSSEAKAELEEFSTSLLEKVSAIEPSTEENVFTTENITIHEVVGGITPSEIGKLNKISIGILGQQNNLNLTIKNEVGFAANLLNSIGVDKVVDAQTQPTKSNERKVKIGGIS